VIVCKPAALGIDHSLSLRPFLTTLGITWHSLSSCRLWSTNQTTVQQIQEQLVPAIGLPLTHSLILSPIEQSIIVLQIHLQNTLRGSQPQPPPHHHPPPNPVIISQKPSAIPSQSVLAKLAGVKLRAYSFSLIEPHDLLLFAL
jgi:hypothetical protein